MKNLLLLAINLCVHGAGLAQISADRYLDGQGVEIIVGRGAASHLVKDTAATPPREGKPAMMVGTRLKPLDAGKVGDSAWHVSAPEQARRDKDRLAILAQELEAEMRSFSMKKAVVAKAAFSNDTGRDQRRLNEEINEHQSNIKAIEAEIRRTHTAH